MEYQFEMLDRWATKISYGPSNLPELETWDVQLADERQRIIEHFTTLRDFIYEDEKLKLYILYHYDSLEKLILEVSFIGDIYKELLLKSLEQIRFFFDLKYREVIKGNNHLKIVTTLSVEEFAYIVNSLIECDIIRVKSKKALARNINRFISFAGSGDRNVSSANFYNALFKSKPGILNGALKTINKLHTLIAQCLKFND